MRHRHHDKKKHREYSRYVDLYAELNYVLKKLKVLSAITPMTDPLPFTAEITVVDHDPQFIERPRLKEER
jgi:hypothetical protein